MRRAISGRALAGLRRFEQSFQATFVVRFGENGITEIVDRASSFRNRWAAQVFRPFAGWVETSHSEDDAIMFDFSVDVNRETLDLYETNTNRFVEAQQEE